MNVFDVNFTILICERQSVLFNSVNGRQKVKPIGRPILLVDSTKTEGLKCTYIHRVNFWLRSVHIFKCERKSSAFLISRLNANNTAKLFCHLLNNKKA